LLKLQKNKPLIFNRKSGELPLSGESLIELLMAVFSRGADFRFRAKGFSMSPFIKDGDVVTLSPLNSGSLGVGTVVATVYPRTGKLVVHRVVGKRGSFYSIKGDNLPGVDAPVLKADIQGYVTRVERNGKRVFFGLGRERFLIAFLARMGLFPKLRFVRNILFKQKSKPINE